MAKAKKGAKVESSTEKAAPKKKGAKEKAPASFDTTEAAPAETAKKPKGGGGGGRPRVSPARVTFYGFASYVGALKGPTHCEWWSEDPNDLSWSPAMLIPTDLSKTPTAAKNKLCSISEIQCDDHRTDNGITQIGPRFPQGTVVGALWLSENYWKTLGPNQPKHPASPDAHDYELTSIVYVEEPIRRFYGVHAKIIGKEGPLRRVHLWHPGRSKVPGERPFNTVWIDLAQDAHPVGPGATQISDTVDEGALFLNEATAKGSGLRYPKLPSWAGAELL